MAANPAQQMGIRKSELSERLEAFFAEGGTAKCPAAQIGHYADSRNRYLNCKVEDQQRPGHGHFATKENPAALLMWCCNDYGQCPVWQASRDRDPILDRVKAAQEQADSAETHRREIAAGIRLPDADDDPIDMPDTTRAGVDEKAIELAAEVQRHNVERHWSEGPKKKGEG